MDFVLHLLDGMHFCARRVDESVDLQIYIRIISPGLTTFPPSIILNATWT